MRSVKLALAGAEELTRALKLADPRTRARVVAAIKHNTQAVASKAEAAAPKKTGELASTIRAEFSNDGLVGFVRVGFGRLPRRSKAETVKGKARTKGRSRKTGKGAFAPVVERGDPRRHHQPHPFLMPGYTAQRPTAINEIAHALNQSVKEI